MKKILKEWYPYIIILLIVFLVRTFIITPVRVDGDSMKKTLYDGDILLLYKLGSINRNDIIVLNESYDDEVIIKRVIGLPGETVEIKHNKIYVNDEEYEDEFAFGETTDYSKIELGEDEYFILGDNRIISKDSRTFGSIKEKEIMGKIVYRLFPFSKIGEV